MLILSGVFREACGTVLARDLCACDGADHAVGVDDRQIDFHRSAVVDRRLRLFEDLGDVERSIEQVILVPWCSKCRLPGLRLDGRGSCCSRGPWPSSGRCQRAFRAYRRGRPFLRWCGSRASAMTSRISSAMKFMKLTTASAPPLNFLRSSRFCVAMPTGQVFLWQTRIIKQPRVTSGAVAKPNSSAPSKQAIATSRPVLSWPSVSTRTRERRSLSSRV